MKRLKVFILIFTMMILTTGVFTGCGDKFKDLSATLDKEEVVIYLPNNNGENNDGESNSETVTLSLDGLPSDASPEIVKNLSNNICDIDIKTDNDTKESKITFTATSGGNAIAQFIHKDSNKLLASVSIKVVKKVKSISQNMTNNAIVVSGVGSKVVLSTSKIINFDEPDTTQKDVIYKLKDNVAGVEVDENGVITFNQIPTSNKLNLTATVKDTQISTDLELLLLPQLTLDNFDISYTFDENYEKVDLNKGITLVNNRSLFKAVDIKIESNLANQDIEFKLTSLDSNLVSVNKNEDNYTIVTGNKKGQTSIAISAYISGYEDITKFDFPLPINVIKVADNIKINDSFEKEQSYDIFDIYANNLGQEFKVVVGNEDASNLDFALVIESGADELIISNNKGNLIEYTTSLDDELIAVSDSTFFIKAKDNFTATNEIKVQVVAISSKDYDSQYNKVISTLNLTLRKGVDEIKFEETGNTDINDTTYYVPMNNTRKITFSIKDNCYSNAYQITSKGGLEFEQTLISNGLTKLSFDVVGTKQGDTKLTVTAQNGISNTINIKVFYELQYFSLSADSYLDNSNIGSSTYSPLVDENDNQLNIQSLQHIAIKEGKTIAIYLNKYDKNEFVIPSASISEMNFDISGNTDKIALTNSGDLYARKVTDENSSINVKCNISYYTIKGITEYPVISFECEIFRAINGINIANENGLINDIVLYYSKSGEMMYYYKDLMQQTLKYRLNPISATHISNVKWEFDTNTISYTQENKDVTIKAKNGLKDPTYRITATLTITQFNKSYIKRFPITIFRIEEILNFSNISYNIDGGNEKALYSSNEGNNCLG